MCRSIAMPVGVSSVPAAIEVRLCACGRQNKLLPHTLQNPRSALAERAGHRGMMAARATALRAVAGDHAAQLAANRVAHAAAEAASGMCRIVHGHTSSYRR
jgi:hypothetical protein